MKYIDATFQLHEDVVVLVNRTLESALIRIKINIDGKSRSSQFTNPLTTILYQRYINLKEQTNDLVIICAHFI